MKICVGRWLACVGMGIFLSLGTAARGEIMSVGVTKDAGLDWRGWLNAESVWIYKGAGGCAAFYGDVVSSLAPAGGGSVIINSATFNYRILNSYEHSDPFTIRAFRITQDWSDATNPANTTGPAYAEGYGTVLSPLSGIVSVDVTNLVRSWVAGTYPNYGVRIQDSNGWSSCAIYSEEVGDWRPTFTIDYTVVPEPATLGILLGGILFGMQRRKS